jgi:hypothetical protein
MSKTNGYILKVKGDKAGLQAKLSAIPGVTAVSVREAGEWLDVSITSGKEDIGEKIYKCIFENGWSLAELKRHSASLEDVFTQLTRG